MTRQWHCINQTFFYQYCHHRWEGQLLLSWPTWVKYTVPQKTSHLWLAITSTHVHWFWYVLAEMLPIKYTIKRCFTMPPQITSASALPGKNGKRKNCIFQWLYKCIARIQPVAAWFLLSFWLTTHTHTAVWLPKSCSQCIQLGPFGGMVQEKGSRERCSSWTVLHAQCTSALSSGFPISQGNAEALDRWGGKTK